MNGTLENGTETASNIVVSSYVGYTFTSVGIIGSLGNILVIFSICRQYLYKNTHYYVVLHLSVCDLLNSFPAMLHSYKWLTGRRWTISTALCKLTILPGIFFTAGVLFMVFMSMLRYRAVFYPLRTTVTRLKLHLVSASLYVFGLSSQIPLLFVLDYIPPDKCFEAWPSETWNIAYTVFLSSIQFCIPIVILGVVYWKICNELVKQGRIIKSMDASATTEERKRHLFQRLLHHRNTRAFVISFVIFVCFFVAGSPQQIAFILHVIGVVDLNGRIYYGWLRVLYFFGVSAVNPFIYGALDRKVFSSFKQCRRKNRIGVL